MQVCRCNKNLYTKKLTDGTLKLVDCYQADILLTAQNNLRIQALAMDAVEEHQIYHRR